MSENAQIFISYSRQDEFFVHYFIKNLKQRLDSTNTTWLDTEQIRKGQDWVFRVDNAIRNSYAVILILSPDSVKSPHVSYEWSSAMGAGKPLIPIVYRSYDLQLPPKLHNVDRYDFSDFKKMEHSSDWQKLAEELAKARHEHERQQVSPKLRVSIIQTIRDSQDNEDVKDAIIVAGSLHLEDAALEIAKHLSDYIETDKQEVCIRVLGILTHIETIQDIVPMLYHPVREIRRIARDTLTQFDVLAAPHLLELIDNKASPIRDDKPVGIINAVSTLINIARSQKDNLIQLPNSEFNPFNLFYHQNSWIRGEVVKLLRNYITIELAEQLLYDNEKAFVPRPEVVDMAFIAYDKTLWYDRDNEIGSVSLMTAVALKTVIDDYGSRFSYNPFTVDSLQQLNDSLAKAGFFISPISEKKKYNSHLTP